MRFANNIINAVDPSGLISILPEDFVDSCKPCDQQSTPCKTRKSCHTLDWGAGTLEDGYRVAEVVAACLLCDDIYGPMTDLEKLAFLSRVVAMRFQSKDEYLEIMSKIILGEKVASGVAGGWTFSAKSGWGYHGENDANKLPCSNSDTSCICKTPCPNNANRVLNDTGFHPDFRDSHLPGGGNQVFHFWGSVNVVGAGNNFFENAFLTNYTYFGFQIFHEGLHPWGAYLVAGIGSVTGLPLSSQHRGSTGSWAETGGSWQDIALTNMGIVLGKRLALGRTSPLKVSEWLRENLGVNSDGAKWMIDAHLFNASGFGPNDSNIVIDGIEAGASAIDDTLEFIRDGINFVPIMGRDRDR